MDFERKIWNATVDREGTTVAEIANGIDRARAETASPYPLSISRYSS